MTLPTLLDHLPVQRALTNPATSYWLRDLLISAASRDPVDVLNDLDAARALLDDYFGMLTRLPMPLAHADGQQNPD